MLGGLPQEVLLRVSLALRRFGQDLGRLRIVRGRSRRGRGVELVFADQRRVDPRQLMVASLLPNVVSNPAHDGVDGYAGVEQMGEEGLRERAVLAGRSIERRTLRIAGESDERPAGKVAID